MMTLKLLISICFVGVTIIQGCVSDDFNDIARGFSPMTPRQAAEMAGDQYSPDERREGITLLSTSPFGGGPEYVRMYRDYVSKDLDPLVRASAIKALARFGDSSDAMVISPWLNREVVRSVQVRREAALALQRIHNRSVVPSLLQSLGDEGEEETVRSLVATALGQYQEDRVLVGLMFSLSAKDLSINLSAAESLHILTGQVFGIDRYAWVDWYNLTMELGSEHFEAGTKYEYPTFQYESQWWDHLVFWEERIHEKPSVPTGLEDPSRRSTYDDDVTVTP
jgi:hypothetical protein